MTCVLMATFCFVDIFKYNYVHITLRFFIFDVPETFIYSCHITLDIADKNVIETFLRGNAEFVNEVRKQRRLSY
jgi:hypothetical protein